MAKEPKDILEEGIIGRLNGENPSNRDIAEGVKYVIMKLWSEDQLNSIIDRRHKELCERCPLKTVPAVVSEDAAPGCAEDQADEGEGPVTRRTVLRSLKEIALETIKAPWFWIPVATGCGILCAKYNISLPVVGGGN